MASSVRTASELESPSARFFPQATLQAIAQRMKAEPGDLLLFVADKPDIVADALANLRQHLGEQRLAGKQQGD